MGNTVQYGIRIDVDGDRAATVAIDGVRKSTTDLGTTAQAAGRNASAGIQQVVRETEAAQAKMAISAKQTAAALRGVPAQFTDIFTSLQGGQAPLTVFLQQGGQLKDMFGGAGAATRAMGGYVLGLINPLSLGAAALIATAVAYNQGSKEADAYNRSIIMSGNVAGTTAGQLAGMARNISASIGTQGEAAAALAAITGTGQVAASNIEYFSMVAVKAQRTLGIGAADMAKDFASLGDSPLKASEQLTAKYHYLTSAVYEQIKAAEEQGRVDDAAAIAQKAFADAFGSRADQVEKNLGSIERGWRGVTDWAKSGWDAILDIGRTKDTDELDRISQIIANKQSALASRRARTGVQDDSITKTGEAEIATLKLRQELLQSGTREQIRANEAKAASNRIEEAKMEWSKEGNKYLDREAQKHKEIAAAVQLGTRANLDASVVKERVAAIEAKYADKGAAQKAAEALRKEASTLAEMAGLTSTFAAEWGQLNSLFAKGKITTEQLTDAQAKLLAKQPAMKEAAESTAAAEKWMVKFRTDYIKATEMMLEPMKKAVSAAVEEADKNEQLARTFGMTAGAIERAELARLEEQLAQRASLGLTLDEIDYLEKLIAAKSRNAAALSNSEGLAASKKASEELKEDYKRMSESIEEEISGALMRGFEDGKSFGSNLVSTLKNMFKTLILKPTISAIMAPISGAIGSALLPGVAQAAAGSGAGSVAGGVAGGLLGAGGLSGSIAAGAGWLSGATTLGGSLSAGASLFGTGTVAGGLSGAGMIVGALAPIALGIGAAVAIWKKLDTSGTKHTGGAAKASADGVSTIRAESLGFQKTVVSKATEDMTRGLASGIVNILDSTATAFGKSAGYTAATAFADDTSKDGAWGALVIEKMGQAVVNWDSTKTSRWAPKEFGNGEAGQAQYLAALSSSVRSALDGIGLPSWAQKMLDNLGDAPAIDELAKVVDAINSAQRALGVMGERLVGFAGLSDGVASALMKASGGIESLTNNAASYYENFYSDAEKSASAVKQMTDSLATFGLQLPTTREGYRALIEAELALGESRAPAVAELLRLNGVFAQVVPAAEAAAAAIETQTAATIDHAGAMRDAAAGLLGGVDDAFSVLQRVAQGNIDILSERIAEEKALSNAIRSTLGGMVAQGTEMLSRVRAQTQIRSALAGASAGGKLPSADEISKSLAAISQDSSNLFGTYEDYARDFYTTQNDIAALGDLADTALSVDEKALNAIQEMLAATRDEIDELKGINVNGLTLIQAVEGVRAAIVAAQANPLVSSAASINDAYKTSLGRAPDAAGMQYFQDKVAQGAPISAVIDAIKNSPEAKVQQLYQSVFGRTGDGGGVAYWTNAVSSGMSIDDARELMMQSSEYKNLKGIPAFENGGNHFGGVRLVGEVGPEFEVTGASRIHSTKDIMDSLRNPSGSNAVLVAEVRALRVELAGVKREVSRGSDGAVLAGASLEAAGAGGPLRVRVVNTVTTEPA